VNLISDFPAQAVRSISVYTGLESVEIMWRGISWAAECIVITNAGHSLRLDLSNGQNRVDVFHSFFWGRKQRSF
jgi:hypothetical protein